ncbi:MAG: phosphoribosylformylglycinamidine cyclo-ligase [Candidatus Zixiibacteriota bacterium]|nr:MAG: phosphoribosylformylglycinamidine cyclo-ligase [candidate division Zixibacteria bacterium]
MNKPDRKQGLTYAESGVDIAAGDEAVQRIKTLARKTFNSQVLSDIGAFGGLFKPELSGFERPVLVASTDSVGTKLKIAFMTGIHNTVGEDLVNHCVNDILVQGARPLFFLDYIGIGHIKPKAMAELVSGVSRACYNTGTALLGGETAELPDLYQPGEYDLAGFIVGIVDESKIVDGSTIKPGDICLGLPSNGLHTNGYTMARKVAFEIANLKPDDRIDELGSTIAEALMKIHRCYASVIHNLLEKHQIKGMAHITGGGIAGNLNRVLPDSCDAEIQKKSWPVLPIFKFLEKSGNIDPDDIYSAFNMGIGYIIVVEASKADAIEADLNNMGEKVYRIGLITEGTGVVRLIE